MAWIWEAAQNIGVESDLCILRVVISTSTWFDLVVNIVSSRLSQLYCIIFLFVIIKIHQFKRNFSESVNKIEEKIWYRNMQVKSTGKLNGCTNTQWHLKTRAGGISEWCMTEMYWMDVKCMHSISNLDQGKGTRTILCSVQKLKIIISFITLFRGTKKLKLPDH